MIEMPGVYQRVSRVREFDMVGCAPPGAGRAALRAHGGGVGSPTQSRTTSRCSGSGSPTGPPRSGPDGWTPVARHIETIRVRGGADVAVDVVETERGPLVLDGGPSGSRPASLERVLLPAAPPPVPVRRRTSSTPGGWVTREPGARRQRRRGGADFDAGLVVTGRGGPPAAPRRLVRGRATAGWHPLADAGAGAGGVDANEKPTALEGPRRAYVAHTGRDGSATCSRGAVPRPRR